MAKIVANNSTRPIYVNYREGNAQDRVLFQPGFTEVEKSTLALLLKEPGFENLLDAGTLSMSKKDIKAVKEMLNDKDSSGAVPKPVKTDNQRDSDLELHDNMVDATTAAQTKAKRNGKKTAAKK